MTKDNRGGTRPGAGRKKNKGDQEYIKYPVQISQEEIDIIQAQPFGAKAKFISDAIVEKHDRENQ